MEKEIRKKMTKKNRNIIVMMTIGATFLVATSLTIAVVIVRASSNNDIQAIKNAKMILKKLTSSQKTVDLTNEDNQKLPSEIAPTIKSIKALNDLIKGVIIIPSSVSYTPNVVEIDDKERKFVVEIEIKKGDVKDKFQFVITKFTTKVEIDISKALSNINDKTINGDKNKLPSKMTLSLIKILNGFPKEIDGVYFKPINKDHDDIKGTLTITLMATKEESSKTKEIVISGFKTSTQAQADQNDVDNVLSKINDNTISGNENKLPSQTTPSLITNLKGFPKKNNGINFDVSLKYATNEIGTLLITLRANKGSANAKKEIIISGFKKQSLSDQEDVFNAIAKITNDTISGDSSKLPSEITTKLINDLKGFPQIDNGVTFDHIGVFPSNDKIGTLTVFIQASKGKEVQMKTIIISGFKTQAQANQENVFNELSKINNETINGDKNRLASTIELASINALTGFPSSVNGVLFSAIAKSHDDTKGELTITLKATKGRANVEKEITISGFKKQQLSDQFIIENKLAKINNETIDGDKNKLPSTIELELIKTLNKFPEEINGVGFSVIKTNHDDTKGELTIILKATKGGANAEKEIIISGFKTTRIVQNKINDAKAILDKLHNLNKIKTTEEDKSWFEVKYKNLEEFVTKTTLNNFNEKDQAILKEVTIEIYAGPRGLFTQWVRFTISKNDGESKKSYVRVWGFKEATKSIAQHEIDEAESILKKFNTHTKENTKFAINVKYNDLFDFFDKTTLSYPNKDDQTTLDKFTFSINTKVKGSTSQEVGFQISSKRFENSKKIIVEVAGFKSSGQAQADIKKAISILESFRENVIKTNKNKLVHKVKYKDWQDLIAKTNLNYPSEDKVIALNKVEIKIEEHNSKTYKNIVFTISKIGAINMYTNIIVEGFKKE